jgi:hypothetical protein
MTVNYDGAPLQRRMRDIHVAAQNGLVQLRHYQRASKLLAQGRGDGANQATPS